jgi:hypothetical protein
MGKAFNDQPFELIDAVVNRLVSVSPKCLGLSCSFEDRLEPAARNAGF